VTRLGKLVNQALVDGRVNKSEIDGLEKHVKADGKLSKSEKKELSNFLDRNIDKFDAESKAKLSELLGRQPPLGPPPTPTTNPTAPTAPVAPAPAAPVDLPDPTVLTKDQGAVTYGKIEGGKLFVDGVNYEDVIQGSIANCYMVSAFSAVAHTDPKAIENAMKDNGDGTYTVRFFEPSYGGRPKTVEIRVDGDLPTSGGPKSKYAKAREGTELWVSVLEKAYAQWKGGYESIGNGGISGDVMQALTGKSYRYTSLATTPADRVFKTISDAAAAKRPMAAGTHGKDSGVDYTGTGVYAWHAYTVLGAVEEEGTKYVQLRNPWGRVEHGNDGKDDGIFKMKLDDFMKLYSGVNVTQ
jgi:hypothetical protein